LLASALTLGLIGLCGPRYVKGEEIVFRALPTGAGGSKAKLPVYIGVRNGGGKLLRILPKDVPPVWGYSVVDGERSKKIERTTPGKETRLGDLSGVVFSDSGPPPRQEYCPGEGPLLVALEKGNEMLMETTVDMSFLKDGIHEVALNLVVLTVAGEGVCGATVSERGAARLKLQVRGDRVTFIGRADTPPDQQVLKAPDRR
jgi:hypothetical protein